MSRHADILVVEDNPADQRLAQEVFSHVHWASNPHIVSNGTEALNYLQHKGPYAHTSRPDLIILDYNLPGKKAPEILLELKADRKLRRIPVVIFSVSGKTSDVVKSYGVGADCYLKKPTDFDAYFRSLNGLEGLWRSSKLRSPMAQVKTSYNAVVNFLPFTPRQRKEIFEWSVVWATFVGLWAIVFAIVLKR